MAFHILVAVLLLSGFNVSKARSNFNKKLYSLAKDADNEIPAKIIQKQNENQWFKDGVSTIRKKLKVKEINKKAKNVILFIGDGMGPSTVTAARILDGQIKKQTGEENILSWEEFDNVALSKTYNVDYQVPDSAGTATAFMSGVKTRFGLINVNENVIYKDCKSSIGNEVLSLAQYAELDGLSTGVVTTTRLTHATPSTVYSSSASRSWEHDNAVKDKQCKDIASQLIDFKYGNGLEVALGGGRSAFLPNSTVDEKTKKTYKRGDGRNLVEEWINKTSSNGKYEYVSNAAQLRNLKPEAVDHVLGIFNYDHLSYSYYRLNGTDEPSLVEMVEFAVKVLSKNSKGFFLLVEGGRIDHGHHDNKAFHALHDAVELNHAVQKAKDITDPNETLLIVTADHSHVFTLGGYQSRGNPIFNLVNREDFIAQDNKTYSTLAYLNGPGAEINKERRNVSQDDLSKPDYRYPSLVPLEDETHGGEDVGIYARGPQAHLISGVVEQNYIFHVMDYALCLTKEKKTMCEEEGLINPKTTPKPSSSPSFCFSVIGLILLQTMLFFFN
ncbi:alkaline phosphatase isoform X1 [Hydra vulgaris]|uniref:alkaline phosphatase isoform X1 n=1 Tax=Hydra vulgaris TaxID=6087 RepID=UPI0002B4D616|nr:alkaline phosphatase [Hydra vulgaris]